MKKSVTIFFIVVLVSLSVKANPIAVYNISELTFTENGWQIELVNFEGDSTNWQLISSTDTIQFNDSSYSYDDIVVFEEKDFNGKFNLNESGDSLKLVNVDGGYSLQGFAFGKNGNISAPSRGQSICTTYKEYGGNFDYYLDNSPTIGSENDTTDIKGTIEGYVTDANSNPLSGVMVMYFSDTPIPTYYVLTDENGHYKYKGIAKKRTLDFDISGYKSAKTTIQILPEETITLDTIRLEKKGDIDYYPLSIGNKWTYEYSLKKGYLLTGYTDYTYSTYSYNLSIEVVGDTTVNDTCYYQMLCKRNSSDVTTPTEYFYERYDSTQNWYVLLKHSLDSDTEYTQFNLSEILNDSTYSYFWDYNIIEEEANLKYYSDSTITLFDNETTAINFISDSTYKQCFVQLAKGFGLTKQTYTSDSLAEPTTSSLRLKGCVVDNVVYGDTSIIVGISEGDLGDELSHSFALSQNYPNPFNPATTISYTIPDGESSNVKLIIYNSLGQQVTTLVNEAKAPGNYQVQFNASRFASGVYFYRITTGDFAQTKKMILLK